MRKQLEEASSNDSLVIALKNENSLCQVALTGWMLGYPVIYILSLLWNPDEIPENCLGGVDLVLHDIRITHRTSNSAVTLARFTCPKKLAPQGNMALDGYLKNLAHRIAQQAEFSARTTSSETICLARVVV